jgi:hypothetical protein
MPWVFLLLMGYRTQPQTRLPTALWAVTSRRVWAVSAAAELIGRKILQAPSGLAGPLV